MKLNVLTLVKPSERYVFLYDDDSCPMLFQTMEEFANDSKLSFSLQDFEHMRQQAVTEFWRDQ